MPAVGRLLRPAATTPDEAAGLFRDAVGWLNYRARENAGEGIRLHEPTPDNPALVIITDEHAELPGEAHECADSIARRGRAVAVNLIAATQRPTQTAMGKDTAVRSQMDVRICLRVREKRDVDLILGQGSVNSGWHAHQLTQPGEFLISDPGHTAPERNRAYLVDDQQVARHAARYVASRPRLPAGSPDTPRNAPGPAQAGERPAARGDDYPAPEAVLWDALNGAGPAGFPSPTWKPRAAGPAGGSTTGSASTPRRAARCRSRAATGGPHGRLTGRQGTAVPRPGPRPAGHRAAAPGRRRPPAAGDGE